MVQLYSKVSNPLDVGAVTRQEMANESREMERVFDENKSLREELELLKSQTRCVICTVYAPLATVMTICKSC